MQAAIEALSGASSGPLPFVAFCRRFDTPLDLVWKAWTDPRHVSAWWGPHGTCNLRCSVEPVPGGAFSVDMQGADGSVLLMGGHIVDLEPPRRLDFVTTLPGREGTVAMEIAHEVQLTEEAGRTRMALHSRIVRAEPVMLRLAVGLEEGWRQSLERLTAILRAV